MDTLFSFPSPILSSLSFICSTLSSPEKYHILLGLLFNTSSIICNNIVDFPIPGSHHNKYIPPCLIHLWKILFNSASPNFKKLIFSFLPDFKTEPVFTECFDLELLKDFISSTKLPKAPQLGHFHNFIALVFSHLLHLYIFLISFLIIKNSKLLL